MFRLKPTISVILLLWSQLFFLTPLIAQNESTIKATIRADGSLVLEGTARYTDLEFGGADTSFLDDGPVGIRSVTMGQHLYLKGEKSILLQEQVNAKRDSGGVLVTPDGVTLDDHGKQGGWLGWSTRLARSLTKIWKADVPGQMQVLLEATGQGDLRVIEQSAFCPGADKANVFRTTTGSVNVIGQFRSSVDRAVNGVSKTPTTTFPAGSSAKSVIVMATFVSDHDLQVSIPDLSTFRGLPEEERSLRIARICSILDSAYLYGESDHLRDALLPASLHHRFVPDGVKHHFYSKSADGMYVIESSPPNATHARFTPFINAIFDRLTTSGKLIPAEKFAKRLVSVVPHRRDSLTDLLVEQLESLGMQAEAARVRAL
jgi:hypothetical protein